MKKLIFIILTLVTLELIFRGFFPQSQYSIELCKWGWQHIPHTTVKYYGDGSDPRYKEPITIEYNAQGIRDGKLRGGCVEVIMCLGDSWLEDMGSPQNNLVDVWLERKLRELPDWLYAYVINAGCYGYDNAQELMWYMQNKNKYHSFYTKEPDIVIVFYAKDSAHKENAEVVDGKLKLKYRNLTIPAIAYRKLVSFVRYRSQFGSWILNVINERHGISHRLVKWGFKEYPATIVDINSPIPQPEFKEVDKLIYQRLRAECPRLIILNCITDFSPLHKEFFKENDIEWIELDQELLAKNRATPREKQDPRFRSHRFGYLNNEVVSQVIVEYLKKEGM